MINCAAFTDVSLAQTKKEAYNVNSLGPLNLAKYVIRKIFYLFIFRQIMFFGNKKSKYNESNLVIPKSYYGFTKLKVNNLLKRMLRNILF